MQSCKGSKAEKEYKLNRNLGDEGEEERRKTVRESRQHWRRESISCTPPQGFLDDLTHRCMSAWTAWGDDHKIWLHLICLPLKSAPNSTSSTVVTWMGRKTKREQIYVYVWLSLEKAMAPHSSTLAWKIPWMEEPGRLQSMGSQRVGHDWATSLSLFTFMHWRRKWQPTPVFLPGESQGRGSLVGCRLWGHTESDTTEAT